MPARYYVEPGDRDDAGDLVEDDRHVFEIDGREVEAPGLIPPGWPWHPIPQAEFDFMADDARWARVHAPNDPKARPDEPVDIRKLEVPL